MPLQGVRRGGAVRGRCPRLLWGGLSGRQQFLNIAKKYHVRLRDCAKINSDFAAQGFWPGARRNKGASPAHGAVTEAQRSARAKEPAEKSEVIFARSLR